MHIKKSKMPRSWPIPKKTRGKRFIAVPSHSTSKAISILFILRDILKIAKTKKEVKYMMLNDFVKINNTSRKDENFPVQVFDTINLEKTKQNYRLEIVNKKYSLKEISQKEAESKIIKISGKKVIKDNRIQMNLEDGRNMITKEKFSLGDSVLISTKTGKIEKILPLKKGAKIEIIGGKHAGEKGELLDFEQLIRGKNYLIKLGKSKVSLPYKVVLVIG